MKKNINICSMVAFSLAMLAAQPVFGKCVTNHFKGTTFSNCNEEATAASEKAKGVKFKKSDDDTPEIFKSSIDGSFIQFGQGESGMPSSGGVEDVKQHHINEGVSGVTANHKNWKEKDQ